MQDLSDRQLGLMRLRRETVEQPFGRRRSVGVRSADFVDTFLTERACQNKRSAARLCDVSRSLIH
jgi:hypothetical protein